MLNEFCQRVVTELERTGSWPRLEQVKEAMEKVLAEMEVEAMKTPIVPAVVDVGKNAQGLWLDGPTYSEFVAAGYSPACYPPHGYAARGPNPTPEQEGHDQALWEQKRYAYQNRKTVASGLKTSLAVSSGPMMGASGFSNQLVGSGQGAATFAGLDSQLDTLKE